MELAEQRCQPPQSGALPMPMDEAEALARQLPQWTLEAQQLARQLRFSGFREAIDFVLKVADVAEDQDHHPDITVSYNVVKLSLTTHKVGGLTRNDFIMAARIDRLMGGREKAAA